MAAVVDSALPLPPRDEPAPGPVAPREDLRVHCTSRRAVAATLDLCGRFVQQLGESLPDGIRELAVRDAQWTFEAAVQENICINGQAWQEACEADSSFQDSDIKLLEDQFDEIIVDLATKRKQYPRKIIECVIKIIKAKQEILKRYQPVVHPADLTLQLDPASRIIILERRGETVAQEIGEAMKALPLLIKQGEGFSQVLKMQPRIHLQPVHQEVFSGSSGPEQLEATPPEAIARKPSDLVLPRKRPTSSPQRKPYPLRPRRIPLDT